MTHKRTAFVAAFLAAVLVLCAGCSSSPEEVVAPDSTKPVASVLKPAPAEAGASHANDDMEVATSGTTFSGNEDAVNDDVAVSPPKTTFPGNEDTVNAAVEEICRRYAVTGMSLAAFAGEEIVYHHNFGYADTAAGTPTDVNTIYRIASISKLVTSALALTLWQDGKLDLDADIRELYPSLRNPYFPEDAITARQLMTHTSSLCDGAGYITAIGTTPLPSLSYVLETGGVYTASRPGNSYVYSNLGLGLLSGVIENACGQRIYDYAAQTLFQPMGMDASYTVSLIANRQSIANIYQAGVLQIAPSHWQNMSQVYNHIPIGEMYVIGHGDLYISAQDLAKIGCILAGDGTYMGRRYLTAESLSLLNTEQFADPAADPPIFRGLGSMQVSEVLDGRLLVGHQGNAYGMLSGMFYAPASSCGIVFISNGCSSGKDGEGLYHVNADLIRELWQYFE